MGIVFCTKRVKINWEGGDDAVSFQRGFSFAYHLQAQFTILCCTTSGVKK